MGPAIELTLTIVATLLIGVVLGVGSWVGKKLDNYGNRITRLETKVDLVLGHVNGTNGK